MSHFVQYHSFERAVRFQVGNVRHVESYVAFDADGGASTPNTFRTRGAERSPNTVDFLQCRRYQKTSSRELGVSSARYMGDDLRPPAQTVEIPSRQIKRHSIVDSIVPTQRSHSKTTSVPDAYQTSLHHTDNATLAPRSGKTSSLRTVVVLQVINVKRFRQNTIRNLRYINAPQARHQVSGQLIRQQTMQLTIQVASPSGTTCPEQTPSSFDACFARC